ncbi:MAG TPA: Ni/Fe-hydrogenase, b-type cytochrome subunit [Desulforhopalus sp.]|nr:Ni/Fe-hydrogenase, b-type cytochrome subunit [Desulforhopalus sp.]
MATYEKHHCWSILLRLFHWMFAISIVFLVVTGFYINTPWTNTLLEGSASFPMAVMRYIHFVAAYVFSAAVMIRLFLYIFGNAQERIWDILPITRRNLNNLKMTLLQYSYISDEHDERLGHNILAGLAYLLTFVAALTMVASGFFMLFPETPFWESWGLVIFGSQQSARFVHHLLMWWFMIFAVIHIYLCIWNDCTEPEGLISSIFTGAKFKHKA